MVKIELQVKCTLENLTSLKAEGEDFRWYLKLKCLNCGEESKSYVYLTLQESTPLKGGRGEASMVSKCKLCSRDNSMDIMRDSIGEYDADDSDNNKFKRIVCFECRGMEPTDFSPRTGWSAKGAESAAPFAVDLTEGDWCDYDERAEATVGVYEIEHRFEKAWSVEDFGSGVQCGGRWKERKKEDGVVCWNGVTVVGPFDELREN